MTPKQCEALAVIASDLPHLLCDDGRRLFAAAEAERQAEDRRRTEVFMMETSHQMRRQQDKQDAHNRDVARQEAKRAEEAAEREAARTPVMVTLYHVDGWVREFDAATAFRAVRAEGAKWAYEPWVSSTPPPVPINPPVPRGRFEGVRG